MNTPTGAPLVIREGRGDDLPRIAVVEQLSFEDPWPMLALRSELDADEQRRPLVAERGERLLGYLMAWVVADEYHIVNIAVHPGYRRGGIGDLLLDAGLEEARSSGCTMATLEVRRSNTSAIAFDDRRGFLEVGCRRGY